jgi:putative transposase
VKWTFHERRKHPVKQLYLDDRDVREVWQEFKRVWWEKAEGDSLQLLKETLERFTEDELVRQIGAGWYAHSPGRSGYRCGKRPRRVVTSKGTLGVEIPKVRKGGFVPSVLRRYEQYREDVEALVREMFLSGVSTRQIGPIVWRLTGSTMSASTVSRMVRALDAKVAEYKSEPVCDDYVYLLLDGVSQRVRGSVGRKRRMVLSAIGIRADGTKEFISYLQVNRESASTWEAFLRDLFERGFKGRRLKLIVSDGSPGLARAIEMIYPWVAHQLCWVHKTWNVLNKVRRADQERVKAGLVRIYTASTRKQAVEAYLKWARKWRGKYPRAVRSVERHIEELLSLFLCPAHHRRYIRSVNLIERSFREVRKRTRPMSVFTNPASCDRIIFGVISKLNMQWRVHPLREFANNS